jgi:delta8-fatty-acid desaturase
LTPPIALGLVRNEKSATGWRREGPVELATKLDPSSVQDPSPDVVLTPDMLELGPEHDLDLALEGSRARAYRELKTRIHAAGLFSAPGTLLGYGPDVARYCILASVAAYLYFYSTSMLGYFASAVALGAFWHQLTCKSGRRHFSVFA